MTSSRNKDQDFALKIIYSFLLNTEANEPIHFEDTLSGVTELPFEKIDSYLKLVTLKALKYKSEIINLISPNLRNWTFERLPLMTQAILLLAVTHYVYLKDEDKAVVIDIAIKQAKAYLDRGEHRFVNAILDKVL